MLRRMLAALLCLGMVLTSLPIEAPAEEMPEELAAAVEESAESTEEKLLYVEENTASAEETTLLVEETAEPLEEVVSPEEAPIPTEEAEETVPAETQGENPEETVPAETQGENPEKTVPAETQGEIPEEMAPAETQGEIPEETVPAETGEDQPRSAVAAGNSCGEDAVWYYSGTTLTIAGTGDMENYDFNKAPWRQYAEEATSIVVEDGITSIGSYAFVNFSELLSVSFTGSVATIGVGAFFNCRKLAQVQIPHGVTTIKKQAFWDCEALTSLELPNSVTVMGEEAFQNCKKLTQVSIPGSLTEIPARAFSRCEALETLTISQGVAVIGKEAFGDCEALKHVSLPDSVTTISDHAFRICRGLESIDIPNSVTYLGEYAFVDCRELKSVTIPGSISKIGDSAFKTCLELTTVMIGEGVEEIDYAAFDDCRALEKVTFPQSLKIIDGFAFYRTAIRDMELPDGLEMIGSNAFAGCENLTEVTIPSTVTNVGAEAFRGCTALTKARLSPNQTVLKGSTFSYCESLTQVTVPRRINEIKHGAFFSCSSLTTLVLPGVKKFDDNTIFGSCTNLTGIYLGKTLTTVGKSAFAGAVNLKDVYFEGSQEEWESITVRAYNDPLLNAQIHFNVPIPADDYYDFKMSPQGETHTMAFREEYVLSFRMYCNGEAMTEWAAPVVSMEDGDILEEPRWEMVDGIWNLVLRAKMLGTEHLTITNDRTDEVLEVAVTVEPSGLKEYLDNTSIVILDSGSAFAYYLGDPGLTYHFTRDAVPDSAVANDKGIIQVPLGSFYAEGSHEISIEFIAIGDQELERPYPYKARVTVNPLEFRQEWQVSMSAGAGVSIGGLGVELGSFEAQAALGKFSTGAGGGAALTLSRTWENGSQTLELMSDRTASVKAGIESGITGEIKDVEVDLADVSVEAEGSGTVAYGLRIRNYSPQNNDHQKALAVFLLGEVLQQKKNNPLARNIYEKLRQDAFFKSGIDTIEGSGAAATGTFDSGLVALSVSDIPVLSMLEGKVDGSVSISQYNYKNGDAKYSTALSTSQNLESVSVLYFQGLLGLDYLGKDISVEVQKENGEKRLETTSLSAEMHKVSSAELGKTYTNDYNRYVFEEEVLEALLNDTTNFRSYLNGLRISVGNKDLEEMAEFLSDSKIPIPYNNQEKNQTLYSQNVDFDVSLGIGLGVEAEVSYVQTLEHTTKTGYAIQDEVLVTGSCTGNTSSVNARAMDLGDLIREAVSFLAEDVAAFFEKVAGKVQDGVETTWCWIKGKADSTSDWIVSLSYPKGDGWSSGGRVDISGSTGGRQNGGAVTGIAVTVGKPVIIDVTDGAGKTISDLQADPLGLTIRYTAEDLAFASDDQREKLAIYRYEESSDTFRFEGGTLDPETMTVTTQIYRPGQYILAVCVEVFGDVGEEEPPEEESFPHSIAIHQKQITLEKGQSALLTAETTWEEQRENIRWSVEEAGVVTVNAETGEVTALEVGTAYVNATVTDGVTTLTDRCRIDVTEAPVIYRIQLGAAKTTVELFSTAYTQLDMLLIPQSGTASEEEGSVIQSVRFADETAAKLFDLICMDDRRMIIVPTDHAINNPGEVKSSYTGKILATVAGMECETDALTITVKKSLPKLKATIAAFNSFYTEQSQEIEITGGTVTSVAENGALPDWLTLEEQSLQLTENAPEKNISVKAKLLVYTQEWRIPGEVTLNVKNTYKAPKVKLSSTAITVTRAQENSAGTLLKLMPSGKKDTLEALGVTGIAAPEGWSVSGLDLTPGDFLLKAEQPVAPGKITLYVTFRDTERTVKLPLTVKTADVKLKLSKTSITLNRALSDSMEITVTATPGDYKLDLQDYRLTDARGGDKKASGELVIRLEGGRIVASTTEATPANATYKLYVSAEGSKEVCLTVKTVDKAPSVTYKAKGILDLTFPEKELQITPALVGYSGSFTLLDVESTQFAVEQRGNLLFVTCTEETRIGTHTLPLRLDVGDCTVENTLRLQVKRTPVRLKLSSGKLSLNKKYGDTAAVAVTCITKGVELQQPVWSLMDKSGKLSAEGQLDIHFRDGKLFLSTNDSTQYGSSYKLLVRACDDGPAVNLTITVPAENRSQVTASLKAKGSIDVIRDGTGITLTPSYKNWSFNDSVVTELVFSRTENKQTTQVNGLFETKVNADGSYTVTKAQGATLNHKLKYTVKLVASIQGNVVWESKTVSLMVKQGSAKLKVSGQKGTLFSRDAGSQVEFGIMPQDPALNSVAYVEIKEAKLADKLKVLDYGNGQYAIGFREESAARDLAGKTVTVSLNIYLAGNETAKANTTLKLKLSVLK